MDAVSAVMMYDALSDLLKKHGVNLDNGAKSIISSLLNNPSGFGIDDIKKAWSDAQISEEELEDALKNTEYEDGDFNELYEEDVNGDGDSDVTAMDTTGDGDVDTVVATTDSSKEEKDSDKKAKELLDGDEQTSTGKKESEIDGGDHDDVKAVVAESVSTPGNVSDFVKEMAQAIIGNRVY